MLESNTHNVLLQELAMCSGHIVCIDCETTGLQWWSDNLIGVGIWCPSADVHGYMPTLTDNERTAAIAAIRCWDSTTTVIGHNLKFDLHFLGIDPIRAGWRLIDTTILVHLMDSRLRKNLDDAAGLFLGERSKSNFKIKGRNAPIHLWPLELVSEYCENDCRLTYALAEKLLPEIRTRGQWPLASYLMRYMARIWGMERWGMRIDTAAADAAKRALEQNVDAVSGELYESVGHTFNWRSAKQLSRALYDDMGIDKPTAESEGLSASFHGKTSFTETATSAFLLMEKAHHPLGEMVLDLREAAKLARTIENWLELADGAGVVHSNFNVNGTRTGRLSSSKPNMQNIPGFARNRETQSIYSGTAIRQDVYDLRQLFHPVRAGQVFVAIDYKQMEIRMFGIRAGDSNMLEALRTGQDIHAEIAKRIWPSQFETNPKVYREWAKTVSFGQLISGRSKIRPIAGNPIEGNQQPEQTGMPANGSETDSAARPAAAAMPLAA